MDYITEFATEVLPSLVDPSKDPGARELADQVADSLRQDAKRLRIWEQGPNAAKRELLVDVFYRNPALARRVAEQRSVYPTFIERLAAAACDAARREASDIAPRATSAKRQALGTARAWLAARKQGGVGQSAKSVLEELRGRNIPGLAADRDIELYARDPNNEPALLAWLKGELMGDPELAARIADRLQCAVPFSLVLSRELQEIAESRARRNQTHRTIQNVAPHLNGSPPHRAQEAELLGLAFSGGGIRSATFNLGVLQALSDLDLLRRVDYLSTVSGGGYIGSWLAAWAKREAGGIQTVQAHLSPERSPNPQSAERDPIRFLREHSNYLTPKTGFFSADTWTMVSIWLRNTLLIQMVLVLLLAAALLLPRLLIALTRPVWVETLAVFSLVGLVIAVAVIGVNLHSFDASWEGKDPASPEAAPAERDDRVRHRLARWWRRFEAKLTRLGMIQVAIVIPSFVAGLFAALLLWRWLQQDAAAVLLLPSLAEVGGLVGFGGPVRELREALADAVGPRPASTGLRAWALFFVCLLVIQVSGRFHRCFYMGEPSPPWTRVLRATFWIALWSLVASAVGGLGVVACAKLFETWRVSAGQAWHVLAWGTPLLIQVFALTVVMQLGLLGINFPDERREWWSRLGAWLLIYSLGWIFVFGVAIYGPLWIAQAGVWLSSAAGLAWIGSTAAGVLMGKSGKTGFHEPTGSRVGPLAHWREWLAHVAPYVFVLGLLLALSFGLHLLLIRVQSPLGFPDALDIHGKLKFLAAGHWFFLPRENVAAPTVLLLVCLATCVLLALRVDVNEFSMHHFYKNRLVRCYLGASRARGERRPNWFTGFDRRDDIKLASLRVDDPTAARSPDASRVPYIGPYPIINTALNLVKGDDLAWQERKAQSFVFTPHYSGYEVSDRRVGNGLASDISRYAYRPTQRYGYSKDEGIGLGTAIAISGAAANPNMGYHSSAPAAFLMTMFNARLGWWLGSPRRATWTESSPRFGLLYLLADLTGSTNDRSRFVSLSDGGHFENLGLYELVRRRCRYIIACDGEQDERLDFGGLGNAIRKCRVDLGVEIDIRLDRIRGADTERHSQAHCVVGKIRYPDTEPGLLVYLKASLTGDESADVLEYSSRQAAFPHQSTGDQWFDESQFESYRELGHHIATATFERAVKRRGASLKDMFGYLDAVWYPPSPAIEKHFVKHVDAYDELLERVRRDDDLRFLDPVLFPRLSQVVGEPPTPAQQRSGFYLCHAIIQLMESVYLDLHLEEDRWHPHNAGWIKLFRQWACHEDFRSAWAVSKHTYGEPFRRFCESELGMEY